MASLAFVVAAAAAAAVVGLVFGGGGGAAVANAEEVTNYRMCYNTKCSVNDVFINPCREAAENRPCEVPQGHNASITFKYATKFNSTNPVTRLYATTTLLDLPFMDMDTNACLYTACPVVANTQGSWLYDLFISTNYPKGGYTVKLKFWNGDSSRANSKEECCFKFDIKII